MLLVLLDGLVDELEVLEGTERSLYFIIHSHAIISSPSLLIRPSYMKG